jgi:predicted HicB family RNase H-like nuclease
LEIFTLAVAKMVGAKKIVLDSYLLSCYQFSMVKNRREVKEMKGTMFRLDPDTHKALRIAAIEEGISMQEALTQAVEKWLKEHSRKGGKK